MPVPHHKHNSSDDYDDQGCYYHDGEGDDYDHSVSFHIDHNVPSLHHLYDYAETDEYHYTPNNQTLTDPPCGDSTDHPCPHCHNTDNPCPF